MIPKKSCHRRSRPAQITLQQVQATQPPRPRKSCTAPRARKRPPPSEAGRSKDNPWFACKPTSIIRDWTADWPINRIPAKDYCERRKGRQISSTVCTTSSALFTSAWPAMHRIISRRAMPATRSATGKRMANTLVVDTVGFARRRAVAIPRLTASRCISSSASRSIRRSLSLPARLFGHGSGVGRRLRTRVTTSCIYRKYRFRSCLART